MKWLFTIGLFLLQLFVQAQSEEVRLIGAIKKFHYSLVNKNMVTISNQTDELLSYGHSNGWLETKNDLIKNLETGYLKYYSISEDSLNVVVNGNVAHARFVGDFHVSLNSGNPVTYRLKVLEVWMKKGDRWVLFARQAVRGN